MTFATRLLFSSLQKLSLATPTVVNNLSTTTYSTSKYLHGSEVMLTAYLDKAKDRSEQEKDVNRNLWWAGYRNAPHMGDG
jgi:hypothetical protein